MRAIYLYTWREFEGASLGHRVIAPASHDPDAMQEDILYI